MTDKPLIILASARKQGYTSDFLNKVFANIDHKLIDLLDFHVYPYNYSNNYPDDDDFQKITDELLLHKVIVFATPVYWYAMSGLMKTFFDRFTDLVTIKKQLGKQLKGKSIFLLAAGTDPELPNGFEIPFKLTSEYLNMTYKEYIYYSTRFPKTGKILQEAINSFTAKIETALSTIS